MMQSKIAFLTVVLATAAFAMPAEAQRGPGGRRGAGPEREQLEQRVRARMGEMMRERLGLTEEQGVRLSEVIQASEAERRELFQLEQATRRRVEALILEGNTDETEAAELLERQAELKVRAAQIFQAEQRRLLEILSPSKVLQLQALREEVGARIRQLRGGRGREEGGRGGPGSRGGGVGAGP